MCARVFVYVQGGKSGLPLDEALMGDSQVKTFVTVCVCVRACLFT
jgi:hypothetical protein